MEGPDILATATPRALFGDAVDDPRALKRSYATLIRQFDPDGHPEVFAHIRQLYEAARDGDLDRAAFVPHLVSPLPESAAEKLERAMNENQAEEAIALLVAHDLDLRITTPNAWFAAIAALVDARTFDLPADLLSSWLDGIANPPATIPDELLDRIELLTSTGIDYQAARADPAIHPALLDLIAQWGASPVQTAKAFMAAQDALPDHAGAVEAFEALKTRYPGLWYPLTLMVNMVTHEVEAFDEAASEQLKLAAPAALEAFNVPAARDIGYFYAAILAAAGVFFATAQGFKLSAAVFGLGGLLIIAVPFWRNRQLLRRQAYPNASSQITSYARENVLFPAEVLDLVLPARNVASAPPRCLLQWQQDPTTLMRVLTSAHLDRIRARTSAS